MYRVLFLFLLISIMDLASGYYNLYPYYENGFHPYHNDYQTFHQHEDYDYQEHCNHNDYNDNIQERNDYSEPSYIEEIVGIMEVLKGYVEADSKFENFCNNYSKVSPLITYGRNECVYKYVIPGNAMFKVEVRIMKKVLEISVMMQDGDSKTGLFTDIRVLPDILNFSQAEWSLSERDVIITIPYKVPLMTEFPAQCNIVNNDIITVPRKSEPKFEYRMGE